MAYNILIDDDRIWRKDCSKIQRSDIERILRAIRRLEAEPWTGKGQVKPLKNYPIAKYRLRCGDYRVLFDKDEEKKIIWVQRVLHRSKLY